MLRPCFPAITAFITFVLFAPVLWAGVSPLAEGRLRVIVARMEAAYRGVNGYQTETEVIEYRDGRVAKKKRFLYSFMKPDHIRIDMESPNPGMILVYPDRDGRVFVRPGGWTGFFRFHLAPDSALFRGTAGQRFDQTDMGLLIRHIARCVTDRRRGEVTLSEQDSLVRIEVVADDNFLAGVLTLYRFTIDKGRWMPVEVEELTPDGVPKRTVIFRDLRTSSDLPDNLFRIN